MHLSCVALNKKLIDKPRLAGCAYYDDLNKIKYDNILSEIYFLRLRLLYRWLMDNIVSCFKKNMSGFPSDAHMSLVRLLFVKTDVCIHLHRSTIRPSLNVCSGSHNVPEFLIF